MSGLNHLLNLLNKDLRIHSLNVAFISYLLAKELCLPESQIKRVSVGSLFHDIGKTKIPKHILYKKGILNNSEFKIIQKHCIYGDEMLRSYEEYSDYMSIVKYHHEKWDGSGYFGLQGNDIPLESRIASIADSFDAMTSVRVYQRTKNIREAVEEVNTCSGTQFDPLIVNVFNNALTALINPKNAYGFYRLLLNESIISNNNYRREIVLGV